MRSRMRKGLQNWVENFWLILRTKYCWRCGRSFRISGDLHTIQGSRQMIVELTKSRIPVKKIVHNSLTTGFTWHKLKHGKMRSAINDLESFEKKLCVCVRACVPVEPRRGRRESKFQSSPFCLVFVLNHSRCLPVVAYFPVFDS